MCVSTLLYLQPLHRSLRVQVDILMMIYLTLTLHYLDLDMARLQYSYKQHCVVSLTVDAEANDPSEWHLATYDPHNENKYHYKLHSLDIYFWTQGDALQFVNGIRRVLPPGQVKIIDEPGPPARNSESSPTVQQLERLVLTESSANGKQPELLGASDFAPMAYNPAAPAAPEVLQHREKTPPPDDGAANPLAMAMAYDTQPQAFGAGFPPPPPPPGGPRIPGPPAVAANQFGGATHPGLQRSATMPVPTGSPHNPYTNVFSGSSGPTPPPPPPPATKGHPQYQPQATSQSTASPPRHDYSVHQQMYRPEEGEPVPKFAAGKSKLEEQTGRLERGVGGMFKKFEKRFG